MRVLLSGERIQKLESKDKPYDVHCERNQGFMVRVYPTGKVVYYCHWSRGKRKKLGEVGGITFGHARHLCESVMGSVAYAKKDGKSPEIELRPDRKYTLKEYVDERYGPSITAQRKTGRQPVDRLKACFERESYHRQLADISSWVFEKWRTRLLKAGISKVTVNRDLVALKAALSKAVEWKLSLSGISKISVLSQQRPNPEAPVSPLCSALWAACDPNRWPFLGCSALAGGMMTLGSSIAAMTLTSPPTDLAGFFVKKVN